ncbi:MAG: single-stranded DNA-binding protein [Planctomycetota bacterium]|nr:single-stranded DNA-binding protein [Planctomycetota bacterium]
MPVSITTALAKLSQDLADEVDALDFHEPVTHVYDPLVHARRPHEAFLRLAGGAFAAGPADGKPRALMVVMNPGPWGMAQTGVPFGDVTVVRDWMGIDEPVERPDHEHPKRPIDGLACTRNEVSGTRLYGWAAEDFGTPEAFFARYFPVNYCPLSFMEEGGRNRTPDKLPADERAPLFAVCDDYLRRTVDLLEPDWVVGIGAFAEACARRVLGGELVRRGLSIGRMLHPSPASPIANRGWAEAARKDLAKLGLL